MAHTEINRYIKLHRNKKKRFQFLFSLVPEAEKSDRPLIAHVTTLAASLEVVSVSCVR
jgi:hypothetical protein